MAKRESRLTQGMIDSCNAEFARKGAFRMPDDGVRKLLAGTKLREKIIRYYPDASGKGFDSYERDWLMDIFAEKVLGLPHWPCFGSPPEMGEKLVSTVIEKLRAGELLDA